MQTYAEIDIGTPLIELSQLSGVRVYRSGFLLSRTSRGGLPSRWLWASAQRVFKSDFLM